MIEIEIVEFLQQKSKRDRERHYITARKGEITATAELVGDRVVEDTIEYHIVRNRETLEGLTEYQGSRRRRTKGTKVDLARDVEVMIELSEYIKNKKGTV